MYKSYADIKNEYDRIRQLNALKCDTRKAQLYNDHPKLRDYDQKIFSLFTKLVKEDACDEEAHRIEKEIEDLRKERIEFLKSNNIPDNYREVEYTCEKCKDTGFVSGEKCSCLIEKEIDLFDNVSNFKKYIVHDNFSNLDMSYYKQGDTDFSNSYYKYMTNAIEDMKSRAINMDEKPFSIILIGMPGTGKTFLARSLGDLALKRNHSVLYLNALEYVDSLKPDYEGTPFKQFAIKADLFILDDLGTEYGTDFSRTEINYIVDKRLNDNKSTIITTNLMPDELRTRYLAPMCSRIENLYTNCYLSGEDLRRIKNANIK